MFGKEKPEVLVVGAGPVGLSAALFLAQDGVPVRILDEGWRPATNSYALALHGASLALLDELGIADRVLGRAYRVDRVGFYDAKERRAELKLSELSGKYPFVAVVRQDVLEEVLERSLEKLGVKVRWNHRASRFDPQGEKVRVTTDKLVKDSVGYAVSHVDLIVGKSRDIDVDFVVAADGHRSLVRRQREIAFPSVGEAQQFAVFEFDTDADLDGEMRVVFDETTTNVLWPLPDGRCRFSFQIGGEPLSEHVRAKDRVLVDLGALRFPMLDEHFLERLIRERAPWFKGSVGRLHWRMAVRFERRLATTFGDGRMWLVGDAAHIAGPVGAQSMNVGLREARDLTRILTGTLKGSGSITQLATFNDDRLAEWRALLGMEGGLVPSEGADRWVAANADRLLPCVPASGATLAALAGQIGLGWAAPTEA